MQSESLREALLFLAEKYQSYKDVQMTSKKTIECMQDSLESDLVSLKQRLENLLSMYESYLPEEVSFTLNEFVTDLQVLDSQLTDLLKCMNKQLRIDDDSI